MKANKLIGKWAIRTKPVIYETRAKDSSYCSTPLFILKATDDHIICLHYDKWLREKDKPYILNSCWCDDGWISYKKLIKLSWWIRLLKLIAYRFIK